LVAMFCIVDLISLLCMFYCF